MSAVREAGRATTLAFDPTTDPSRTVPSGNISRKRTSTPSAHAGSRMMRDPPLPTASVCTRL